MPPNEDKPTGMVGKQIGNYKATKLLGKGSMGEVYMAAHPILDKQVAIKVLSEDLSSYPELVSRFKREARAIARIKHDAIVQAFDFGDLDDGRQYYVMELLKGSNLAVYMAAKGPLPWNECMDIALPLLDGLAAAHEAGFIHRDIKPDNIFITRLESGLLYPKIIDFGIAKLKNPDEDQQDSVVTRIDAVMGTPLYMSPEQAPGSTEEVGLWSDIYSAAATLYHMIAGKPPFYSDNPLELMLMHSWQQAPPLFELRPDLALAASDVIMKALAKKPADRYPSMQAFADALKAAASGEPAPKPEETPEPAPETGEAPAEESPAPTPAADEPAQSEAKAPAEEPAPKARKPVKTAEGPAVAAHDEIKAPEPIHKLHEDADDEEPIEALASDRPPKPVLTSLSGAASEKVINARLPSGTYFAQPKSKKPYVIAGVIVALIVAAAIVFLVTRGSKAPPAKPLAFRQLSSMSRHTCAVHRTDGTAWCWGRNNYGQLGNGDTATHYKPVRVAGVKDVLAVAAGGRHTCALKQDGTVWCWGKNDAGQLGDNTQKNRTQPVWVAGLVPARAIATGAAHSCALGQDGSLWCWGANSAGQLGVGRTYKAQPKPVRVTGLGKTASMTLGGFHSCAIGMDGNARCWGKNDVGQLGVGSTIAKSVPTQLAGLGKVTRLTAGGAHTCALGKGEVWCWGNNASGQLGDGTSRLRFAPVKVPGLTDITSLSAGGGYLGGHTCAAGQDGTAWCWGNNLSAQLGLTSPADTHQKPSQLDLVHGVVAIEAGGRHTCALRRSGDVRCWGRNTDGQLGDGSGTDRPKPTRVKR